jgi:hypothetical protein
VQRLEEEEEEEEEDWYSTREYGENDKIMRSVSPTALKQAYHKPAFGRRRINGLSNYDTDTSRITQFYTKAIII